MKTKFYFFSLLCLARSALAVNTALAVLLLAGCGKAVSQAEAMKYAGKSVLSGETVNFSSLGAGSLTASSVVHLLDELADFERAGMWIQGMALTESSIRESAGDYAGAVVAAYKELAWAYGKGLIQKEEMENGILNVLAVSGNAAVTVSVNAVLAFLNGYWDDTVFSLRSLFAELDEPDGFVRWMILVCDLEKDSEDKRAAAAYKSIRARYAQFPEYWYRGARAFSGMAAAEFAENCINMSFDGPFADECRSILAVCTGLKSEDGVSIKTKLEIESIITQSINSGNPMYLDSLMPLISLSDNPYTVYAVGALRALAGVQRFKDYFYRQAASAKGRLAERLSYICNAVSSVNG